MISGHPVLIRGHRKSMIPQKLLNHLAELKVKYKPIVHKTVYTAYDAAATMKAKLNEIPKVLHVVADKKRHIIVVVPADYQVDLPKLKKALQAKKIEFASEPLMKKVFKIKKGALTAFEGVFAGAEVLVDKAFAKTKKVIANAGTFTDSVEMKTKDFMKATKGKVGKFGKLRKFKKTQMQKAKKPKGKKSKKSKATRK